MIFVTGDLHGDHDIKKLTSSRWKLGKTLSKSDFLIITGDFGLIWSNPPAEVDVYWSNWLAQKPWTTLVVLGNHENYDMIEQLPHIYLEEVEGPVQVLETENGPIYILKNGHVYVIEGKTFAVMGGATSTDKDRRIEGKSWWKQEVPDNNQWNLLFAHLDEWNWKVDFVLTHTAPSRVIGNFFPINAYGSDYRSDRVFDPVSMHLEDVLNRFNEKGQFTHWYFGHMHHDGIQEDYHGNKKFIGVYNKILEVK